MVRLSVEQRTKLLEVLAGVSQLDTEPSRRTALTAAGLDHLAAKIDLSGASELAVVRTVDFLATWGRVEGGREALDLFLVWVKTETGVDNHALLDALIAHCQRTSRAESESRYRDKLHDIEAQVKTSTGGAVEPATTPRSMLTIVGGGAMASLALVVIGLGVIGLGGWHRTPSERPDALLPAVQAVDANPDAPPDTPFDAPAEMTDAPPLDALVQRPDGGHGSGATSCHRAATGEWLSIGECAMTDCPGRAALDHPTSEAERAPQRWLSCDLHEGLSMHVTSLRIALVVTHVLALQASADGQPSNRKDTRKLVASLDVPGSDAPEHLCVVSEWASCSEAEAQQYPKLWACPDSVDTGITLHSLVA